MLDLEYLEKLENYLTSGDLAQDFEYSPQERRFEILEFLEKLMDVAEVADEVATKVIFKETYMGATRGNGEKDGAGASDTAAANESQTGANDQK